MNKRQLQWSAVTAVSWILILAVTLTSATYAWFTVNAVTNVEPLEDSVGQGDMNLLISSSPDGPFDRQCQLKLQGNPEEMIPVSTADLNRFYEASAQNTKGIASLYRDVTDKLDTLAVHGKVYLKSEYGDCDVYLRRTSLDFGTDAQMLSAMRFGMKINTRAGMVNKIFRLDDLGNTGGAVSQVTIAQQGSVVSSADTGGAASLTSDPSVALTDYLAVENGNDDEMPRKGSQSLCRLSSDEVASVEFWLYLEGCDENCVNQVQQRNAAIKFGFAGVPVEQEGTVNEKEQKNK